MLDKISEELTCPMCKKILVDPVITKCCQQTYCRSCIEPWVRRRRKCYLNRHFLGPRGLRQSPHCLLNILYLLDRYETTQPAANRRQSINIEPEREVQEAEDVIDSARRHINEYVIELIGKKVSQQNVDFFTRISKEAIEQNNTFFQISMHLDGYLDKRQVINRKKPKNIWVFNRNDVEPFPEANQYFRIRFDNLVIKLFRGQVKSPNRSPNQSEPNGQQRTDGVNYRHKRRINYYSMY